MEHIPEFYKKTSIGITMFGQMVNVYLLGMRVILGSTSPRSFIQPYRAKSACKDQRPAILISHKLTWLATQRLVNSSLCAKLNLRDSFTKICWGCYENLPTVFCTNFVFSPEFSDNFKTSGSLPKIHPDWLENLTSKMLTIKFRSDNILSISSRNFTDVGLQFLEKVCFPMIWKRPYMRQICSERFSHYPLSYFDIGK